MKFADPKNDLAFKKIFGDENHKDILISFLNAVLGFEGKQEIVDVSLANPYQAPEIPELKETILDINAKNKNGDKFVVEMQKEDIGAFAKRSLYYTSKAYVEQLSKGKEYDYTQLKKVYFIGIVNFTMFDNDSYISRRLIINQETSKQDLDDFEFNFIELPKFTKSLDELETTLDKWIFFIKHASDLTMIPAEYSSIKEFKEAFDIATQTAWNKDELDVYEYIAIKEFDEINALRTAEKKGIQKGKEEGLKEGIQKGKEEGLKEGIQKGKIEGLKKGIQKGKEEGLKEGIQKGKIEIAKSLLDVLDDKTIASKTGLSIELIKSLREER